MESITQTFTLLWKTRKGFEIRDMGDHMVLFVFPEASDIDRVLLGEPWTFDRHLMALKRMDMNEDTRELDFSTTRFWLQVHGLPLRSFSMAVAKEIVSIARSVDTRASEKGCGNAFNFIRIKVAVNTSKPLCQGHKISMANGKEG